MLLLLPCVDSTIIGVLISLKLVSDEWERATEPVLLTTKPAFAISTSTSATAPATAMRTAAAGSSHPPLSADWFWIMLIQYGPFHVDLFEILVI